MHGQFPRNLVEKLVGNEQFYRWLKIEDIKGETEITVVAVQDKAISTNPFENKILKEEFDRKCRLYKLLEETIDHLTSGCCILAKNEYLKWHDKVCALLHYLICKALGTEKKEKCYMYTHTHTHNLNCVCDFVPLSERKPGVSTHGSRSVYCLVCTSCSDGICLVRLLYSSILPFFM